MTGVVLRSFTDVKLPWHLSLDSKGHLLVADRGNHHILLLNSQLKLQRVLIDSDSQVELWWPSRLCYNELTSQLYILRRNSSSVWPFSLSIQLSLNVTDSLLLRCDLL